MSGLVERLGFEPNERLLIVSCDDLGFSYSANVAVYEALREGIATSASLMVPAPWARGAAAAYRGEDVGAHLTLNAEHELYRWGPITQSPSLFDGEGGFPRTIEDVWEHADLDEVRREWRAQIERAILWGFDITHLDAHLGGVELRPEFFDCYLDMATEFALPVRLPNEADEGRIGFRCRSLAQERGVIAADYVISVAELFERLIEGRPIEDALPAGVTEVRVVPSRDSPELRASAIDWQRRVRDGELVSTPGPLADVLCRDGVRTIGYRALRDLNRRPSAREPGSDYARGM
jgi:chitin disaccharide deacetylase